MPKKKPRSSSPRRVRQGSVPTASKNASKPGRKHGPIANWLFDNRNTLLAVGGLYLLIVVFFAPVVFQGMGLSPAADMTAVAGMNKLGEDALRSGRFPLWNPTLFTGLPMFASLQYALFTYPPEFLVRWLSYIFGPSHYRIWLFHYFLAGIFAYLLARHYRCGRIASWFAGAGYAFSPQLIVLVDVAHGSKLMGMVYLPLLWLLIDRLRQKPTPGRAALLGVVFAVEILALHPQVAAYAGMMMGLYLVYYGVRAVFRGDMRQYVRTGVLWIGSMAIALAVSSVLWMSVLDYARYSIRGADNSTVTGAGVTWEYATGWSFHPFESISYLFPRFFGFAGRTYWGSVGTPDGTPFTQNPMYFGIVIVIFAVIALFFLPRRKWGFPVVLGVIAWVLSFGKYLPILYGPMFHLLPLFNKFRAPVMGQVLLLLPAVILAAMGIQAILDCVRERKATGNGGRYLLRSAAVVVGVGIAAFLFKDLFTSVYNLVAGMLGGSPNPQVLAAALPGARMDVVRSCLLAALVLAAAGLTLNRKTAAGVLVLVVVAVFLIDLFPVNRRLVNFQPAIQQKILFQPEGVVKFLLREKGQFRVHALDKNYPSLYWQRALGIRSTTDPANWLSYWGIQSTTGYFGAKPAPYQKFMTATGIEAGPPYSWNVLLKRPQILDLLNVRFLLTTVPLDYIYEEMSKQGQAAPVRPSDMYRLEYMPRDVRPGAGAFLYRNLSELPRARVVDRYRVIEDFDGTLTEMLDGDWNPTDVVLLDRKPALEPAKGGVSDVSIITYEPERIRIKANLTAPKIVVLADAYYPSGWEAMIDGVRTPIMRADALLRAVTVPPGDHHIEFRFKPKWFYTGLYISIATVILLVIWLSLWYYNRRQRLNRQSAVQPA